MARITIDLPDEMLESWHEHKSDEELERLTAKEIHPLNKANAILARAELKRRRDVRQVTADTPFGTFVYCYNNPKFVYRYLGASPIQPESRSRTVDRDNSTFDWETRNLRVADVQDWDGP